MCGITGFWELKKRYTEGALKPVVTKMAESLWRRGPDKQGVWVDNQKGIAFGHRRLSIIDLSSAGDQPMISRSKKSVLIYNGELYNFAEIRQDLESHGIKFKGFSDTEVVLEACEFYGVERAAQKFNGMFAFAFLDLEQSHLYLARDPLGIKPLYWGCHQGVFFFGSQLKSFKPHPAYHPEINREALVAYFQYNYIPAPASIFKDFYKLEPGHILKITPSGELTHSTFWNLSECFKRGQESPLLHSSDLVTIDLETLLKDAVKTQMVADVPLGSFLSGGIDSSLVTALMQNQSPSPIKTFSIGFEEKNYDEAPYAKRVAQHLGTDHHEVYLTSKDCLDIIPDLPEYFDEPFADASQIPSYLLSKVTREHVKVALSGDGGDEVFAGYNRYKLAHSFWGKATRIPFPIRNLVGKSLEHLSPADWDRLTKILPARFQYPYAGEKIHKLAGVLQAKEGLDFYKKLVTQWEDAHYLVLDATKIIPFLDTPSFPTLVEIMQFLDMKTYLPDDILTKVDRASMAVSLETRVPLLDTRVVEFASRLPLSYKIHEGQSKWILRQILTNYIPASFFERPKQGFSIPLDEWLRGPLKKWAEDLLSKDTLRSQGLLNSDLIHQRWQEHQSRRKNWQYSLWSVLMFQAWYKQGNLRAS